MAGRGGEAGRSRAPALHPLPLRRVRLHPRADGPGAPDHPRPPEPARRRRDLGDAEGQGREPDAGARRRVQGRERRDRPQGLLPGRELHPRGRRRVLHRPQRAPYRRVPADPRRAGRVRADQRDPEGGGLGRRQADRRDQEAAAGVQPEGVPGPPVPMPLDPARRAQDGSRTRVRHDLEDPVREDVRRTLRPARHVHGRLPRPSRLDAAPERPARPRRPVRADEALLSGRRPLHRRGPPRDLRGDLPPHREGARTLRPLEDRGRREGARLREVPRQHVPGRARPVLHAAPGRGLHGQPARPPGGRADLRPRGGLGRLPHPRPSSTSGAGSPPTSRPGRTGRGPGSKRRALPPRRKSPGSMRPSPRSTGSFSPRTTTTGRPIPASAGWPGGASSAATPSPAPRAPPR